ASGQSILGVGKRDVLYAVAREVPCYRRRRPYSRHVIHLRLERTITVAYPYSHDAKEVTPGSQVGYVVPVEIACRYRAGAASHHIGRRGSLEATGDGGSGRRGRRKRRGSGGRAGCGGRGRRAVRRSARIDQH